MKIYASKNYPQLSYMVDTQKVLYSVLSTGYIFTSPEENTTKPKYRYVSLSRDLSAAARRNPKRWRYGVVLDGAYLTEKYKIAPFSYVSHAYDSPKSILVVKRITLYDNGECTLTLLNHPTKIISKKLYSELKHLILSDVQGINGKKKLEHHTGSRSYKGRTIVEQYTYNVPTGGLRLNSGVLSDEGFVSLMKHTNLNETEERLYVNASVLKVNIDRAIQGILVPNGEVVDTEILDLCEENNWDVYTY